MEQKFNDFFKIKNQEVYLMKKDTSDCHNCQNILLGPRLCKKCGFLFCKDCLKAKKTKNKCPHCLNSSTIKILLSHQTLLDKVKLICKFNCEIPLSEALMHMSSCPNKLKMIECWNCKEIAASSSINISKTFKNKVDDYNFIKNKRLRSKNINNKKFNNFLVDSNTTELLFYEKKKINYQKLISLEDDKLKLEHQIHEIKMEIKSKENIFSSKANLNDLIETKTSILDLEQKIENKKLKLKELTEVKERILENIKNLSKNDVIKNDNDQSMKNTIFDSQKEKELRKALELKPKDSLSYGSLAFLLFEVERNNEAEEYYRKAIELDPKRSCYYNNLGIIVENQKRNSEAEEYYRKAILLDENNRFFYGNLALLLSDQKRYNEAETYYRKAILLNPTNSKAYYSLAFFLAVLKRYDEAEVNYRKTIELDPDSSFSYNNLGLILQNQKRNREAEEYYRKAIQLDPNSSYAYFNLSELLAIQGKKNEAEEYYKSAIDLDPSLKTWKNLNKFQ